MVFQQPAAICANHFLKHAGKCLWEELQVWLCLQTSRLVTRPVSKVRQTSAAQVEKQQQEGQVQSQVCGVMQFFGGDGEEKVAAPENQEVLESLCSRGVSQSIGVIKQIGHFEHDSDGRVCYHQMISVEVRGCYFSRFTWSHILQPLLAFSSLTF